MRILFLSDTEAKGGAGIAAARMARALAADGITVGMAVNDPHDGPSVGPWQRFVIKADWAVNWDQVPEPNAEKQALEHLAAVLDDFSPDAVSVHNIHGGSKVGWSVDMVQLCAEQVPTTWTLHDTWSFTGRCAYPNDCSLFPDKCNRECPSPDEYPFMKPERIVSQLARKLEVLRFAPMLAAVAPSQWMARTAARGGWHSRKIRIIPNCLETSVYRPVDPIMARKKMGLAPKAKVVLLCAADIDDPRKGMDLALRALEMMDRPLTLLIMGAGGKILSQPKGMDIRRLGFVSDSSQKAIVYSAADVMIHAALQDNLPNTVMESLSCSTPVVGFAIGGMADMVINGKNGFLSDEISPKGLGRVLKRCLLSGPGLGRAGRTHVQNFFSGTKLVEQWLQTIESIDKRKR